MGNPVFRTASPHFLSTATASAMVLAALGTVVYAQNYYPPPDAKPAPKTSNGLVMGYEPDQKLLVRTEGKPAIERDRAYLTNEATLEAVAEGNGTFLIAIDVARFVDVDTFRSSVDAYFAAVKSVPTDEQTDESLIPCEMEIRTREVREREGVPFPDGTWQTIVDTANEVGIAIPPTC